MTRSRYLAIALALALGAAACDSVDPLAPPDAGFAGASRGISLYKASGDRAHGEEPRDREPGDETRTRPERVPLFDELAELIPGFGGLYRTAHCAVVVVLTDEADREQALAVVRRKLAPILERPCGDDIRLGAEPGEFTYLELRRWLAAARPLAHMEGVERVRIDFQLNRLVFEVESRPVANAVLERLPELGIPADAVVFRVTAPASGHH
jgi:hypothetical protein